MIHGVSLGRYAGLFPQDVEVHDGNRKAWELLLRLQEGESIRLLLHGPPGRGKTHMIAVTLNEIERKWPMGTYVYWTMTRFVVARRMAINGPYDDPVELCIRAHVVFLDDLGAEQQTEWGIAGLYDILEERARKQMPTVVATNCSLEELEQFYGTRTLHRLLGDDARIVRVNGPDRRFEQARREIIATKRWTDAFGQYEEVKRCIST